MSWVLLLFKKAAPSSRIYVETKKIQHPAHPERTQSGFAPHFLLWGVIYPIFLCSVVLNLAALSPPAISQHLRTVSDRFISFVAGRV